MALASGKLSFVHVSRGVFSSNALVLSVGVEHSSDRSQFRSKEDSCPSFPEVSTFYLFQVQRMFSFVTFDVELVAGVNVDVGGLDVVRELQ